VLRELPYETYTSPKNFTTLLSRDTHRYIIRYTSAIQIMYLGTVSLCIDWNVSREGRNIHYVSMKHTSQSLTTLTALRVEDVHMYRSAHELDV
jgi:hypothetical protein